MAKLEEIEKIASKHGHTVTFDGEERQYLVKGETGQHFVRAAQLASKTAEDFACTHFVHFPKQSMSIPPAGYSIINEGKITRDDQIWNSPGNYWESAATSHVSIGDDVDGYFAVARKV